TRSHRYYTRIVLFFFNSTATTAIYTLSLHDALPICLGLRGGRGAVAIEDSPGGVRAARAAGCEVIGVATTFGPRTLRGAHASRRSEEHTSELQSRGHLVCRLLLEKKKNIKNSENIR